MTPKILLVEDNADLRALMLACLEGGGYDVRTASNGREALVVLNDEPPSLMVVDLEMPVMDGAELRRLQLQLPTVSAIPFILVSAANNAERVAGELAMDDVLHKPFDADQLLRIVSLHCPCGQ